MIWDTATVANKKIYCIQTEIRSQMNICYAVNINEETGQVLDKSNSGTVVLIEKVIYPVIDCLYHEQVKR